MDFDEVLEELGELGRFQLTTYFLVCLPVFFAASNAISYIFTAGIPDYRCFIPNCDDPTKPVYDQPWLEDVVPSRDQSRSFFEPSFCERYVALNSTEGVCNLEIFTNETERCYKWVFSKDRTIVTDWEITCLENQWKVAFVGALHFAGMIAGTPIFGVLADKYGRKPVLIFSILLMGVTGLAQCFSQNYVTFNALVFISSVGTSGVYPLAFTIGVELVGKSKREFTGIVINYFYATGEAVIALIAYLFEDWVILQALISGPSLIFVLYYWFVPESVRWLLVQGQVDRAVEIVNRAAKVNGVVLSDMLLKTFSNTGSVDSNNTEEIETVVSYRLVVKEMAKSRKIVLRFLALSLIWMSIAFVYYGISVNATSMVGNKYLNFAMVCLAEIPGYTLAWVLLQKLGRRTSLSIALILCSITCFATLFVPQEKQWATVVLFCVGKFEVTTAFGVVFVHTAEMLPTAIRTIGVGTCSTSARIGALMAPFVTLLGAYVESVPNILFGSVSVGAGIIALSMPETRGIKLPETVEDAKKL